MVWLLGIGLFIIFWFVFPPFRKFALVVGGLIILIIVGFVLSFLHERHKESVSKSLIPTSQVQLIDLRLGKEYSSYKLSGEIKNNSNHQLFNVYLKVTAFDCPGFSITPLMPYVFEDESAEPSDNINPNEVQWDVTPPAPVGEVAPPERSLGSKMLGIDVTPQTQQRQGYVFEDEGIDVIPPTCTTIGQDDNVHIWVKIPPNQVRAIDEAVSLDDMPQVKGTFLWSYEIIGTEGGEL